MARSGDHPRLQDAHHPTLDGEYQVTYPRSFRVPFRAQLKGDHLDIWGRTPATSSSVVTYDSQSDRLNAVRGRDGTAYTLKRIAP